MHTFSLTFTKLEGHTRNCVNGGLGQRADKHINRNKVCQQIYTHMFDWYNVYINTYSKKQYLLNIATAY